MTPTEQWIELFEHARRPSDLHLIAEVDHFTFSEGNTPVANPVRNWLAKYFPAQA